MTNNIVDANKDPKDKKRVSSLPYVPTALQGQRRAQVNTNDPNAITSCGSCCYTIESASEYSDDLDQSFYTKVINTRGFLIASSDAASDTALYEAALTFDKLTRGRPDLEATLIDEGIHLTIIGKDEDLTDVPEYKDYSSFWNRFRALGATSQRPITSCSEENLLCLDGDVYAGEDICVHVHAHTLLGEFLPSSRKLERFGTLELEQAVLDAYENSVTNEGLWDNTFAATNYREYFAEGLQSFFDVNAEGESGGDGLHNEINTRSELLAYDEALYDIMQSVFSTDNQFGCPTGSCNCDTYECPHVEAPSVAPSFLPSLSPSLSMAPSQHPSIEPSAIPTIEPRTNIALDKPTSQSSTAHSGESSRAVDGNNDGSWWIGSTTHTHWTSGNWWKVDLEESYEINDIVVYNRKDCCQDRLQDFIVTIYNQGEVVWTYQNPEGIPGDETYVHIGYVEGDAVMISLPDTKSTALSLAEVEVYGRECDDCTVKPSAVPSISPAPTTPRTNAALSKPTTQSTTQHGGVSSRAADGNINGHWSGSSVTHTGWAPGNWWKVDLEGLYIIDNINVYHRSDCCTWRNRGHIVTIFREGEVVFTYEYPWDTPDLVTKVDVNLVEGDEVMISLPETTSEPLSLAEVEVMVV